MTQAPPAANPNSQAPPAPNPRRWKALAVCLVAGFMTLLDVSIVNVALPSIRSGIGASSSDLQWIVSGYALTFGLVLVPSGRLGDQRGRRTMFIAGVALFTLSSLAAGLAPNPLVLVVARLVQGVGGGILNPQVSALIQELFQGKERGRAFGLLGTVIGVSTAIGPVLGGLIIRVLGVDTGWRWIFFVNIPIGIAAILLSLRLLPAPRRRPEAGQDLDLFGVTLLGAGVIAVLLPLVQEQTWKGSGKWALLVLGLAVLGAFVVWERRYAARGHAPLIDLTLFGEPGYATGTLVGLVYFSGFTGVFFVLTLFFQGRIGYSPLVAGLAITPFALGSVITSAASGRRVTTLGRPLIVAGLLATLAGLTLTDVAFTISGEHSSAGWWSALPLFLAGLGSGLVIAPNQTLTLASVPVQRAGTAGGVLQTGQRMGAAAGIAVVGSVFFAAVAAHRGDFSVAVAHGLWVCVGLVALALVVGASDLVATRRRGRSGNSVPAGRHRPSRVLQTT